MNDDFFDPLDLNSAHLCDVRISARRDGPGRIGSPWGAMMIDYVEEGEFTGPKLRGRVLPGGGDWPAISVDGRHSMQINARTAWETDDGARIYVRYEGYFVLPEAAARGPVDIPSLNPSDYYLRTTPIFRTDDERYLWLNEAVCVGVGRFAEGGLGYRIHQIE